MKDMKKYQLPLLWTVSIGTGLLCAWLQRLILTRGVDENGFFLRGNPLVAVQWILCAAGVAGLFLLTRGNPEQGKYREHFPKSVLLGTLHCAAGVLLFLSSLGDMLGRPTGIAALACWVGVAAAMGTVFCGVCRILDLRPSLIFNCLLCVCFILRLVNHYRGWSSDPQIQDYCFLLLADICLMLAACSRACMDAEMGKPRNLQFFLSCALLFCIIGFSAGEGLLFRVGGCLWAISNFSMISWQPELSFGKKAGQHE